MKRRGFRSHSQPPGKHSGHALSDQNTERLLGLLERLEDVSTVMDVMRSRATANA
jgi:hypothetical protein